MNAFNYGMFSNRQNKTIELYTNDQRNIQTVQTAKRE